MTEKLKKVFQNIKEKFFVYYISAISIIILCADLLSLLPKNTDPLFLITVSVLIYGTLYMTIDIFKNGTKEEKKEWTYLFVIVPTSILLVFIVIVLAITLQPLIQYFFENIFK